ncbi:helix-turn-helix domain-containing protein [Nocardia sp. NPDC005366]|uniref:helix-turn-helix domain-containing protein n=1 Tax=Nocardia sp. NPDC005366 TaxID=3156878 RepID=UPI0033A98298
MDYITERIAEGTPIDGQVLREIHSGISSIVMSCIEHAERSERLHPSQWEIRQIDETAKVLAAADIRLDSVLHAVYSGFRLFLDPINSVSQDCTEPCRQRHCPLSKSMRQFIEVQDVLTTRITAAYIDEVRVKAYESSNTDVLTSAATSRYQPRITSSYFESETESRFTVLALHIATSEENSMPQSGRILRFRTLTQLRAMLAESCGTSALTLLSISGGTVVLPTEAFVEEDLELLIQKLCDSGQISIAAAVAVADYIDVPTAVEETHQLLDLVRRLRYPSGLYHFDDMVREIQLSRPGQARDHLAAILAPLEDYPDLLELLYQYLINEQNRTAIAARFRVHPRTVEVRLKLIEKLTGHYPKSSHGAWVLLSALIARGCTTSVN